MSECDKNLQEVRARRIMFMSDLNTLECDHPKIYKKLSPLFNDICLWMSYAQEYMDALKQSIDTLEATKENNPYVSMGKNNYIVSKDKNNAVYPLDASIKLGYDIQKDNPYV